jgi:hypothetical protein
VPGQKDRDHDARFGREVLPLAGDVHRLALALCGLGPMAEQLVAATLRRAYALSLGACPRQAGVLGTPAAEQRRRLLALCRELFEQSSDSYGASNSAAHGESLDVSADILGSGRVFATTLREGLSEPWPGAQHVSGSIAALPADCRAALVLVDVSGTPGGIAAEILGVDDVELRARLFRGRRLLQERLLEARLTASLADKQRGAAPRMRTEGQHEA